MSDPKYINIGTPETKVIEECSEVITECSKLIKSVCKAQRFGWFNHHPNCPDITNYDAVKAEMEDVVEAFERLEVNLREFKQKHYQEKAK